MTYNLSLQLQRRELWKDELKNRAELRRAHPEPGGGVDGADPCSTCTGTPDDVPDGPAADRGRRHAQVSIGILGTYAGDLFWLACTVVEGDPDVVEAARADSPEDVVMDRTPTGRRPTGSPPRSPPQFDQDEADARNRDVLKASENGDTISYFQGGHRGAASATGIRHAALQHLTTRWLFGGLGPDQEGAASVLRGPSSTPRTGPSQRVFQRRRRAAVSDKERRIRVGPQMPSAPIDESMGAGKAFGS